MPEDLTQFMDSLEAPKAAPKAGKNPTTAKSNPPSTQTTETPAPPPTPPEPKLEPKEEIQAQFEITPPPDEPDEEPSGPEPEKPEGEKPEKEESSFDLEVDGKIEKKTAKEVVALAQKGLAAEKRWAEAKGLQKKVVELYDNLHPERTPEIALADYWHWRYKGDGQKTAEAMLKMSERILGQAVGTRFQEHLVGALDRILKSAVEFESLDPSAREARALKAELESSKREIDEARRLRREQEEAAIIEHGVNEAHREITAELKALNISPTDATLELVLRYWLLLRQSEPESDAKAAVEYYLAETKQKDAKEREALIGTTWEDLQKAPDEEVLQRVPKEVLDRILKATLAKTKADRRPTPGSANGAPPPEKPERPRRVPSYRMMR